MRALVLTARRLWPLGTLAIASSCGDGGERADASAVTGTYVSVTESQCNVELELRANGIAVVSNRCRLEDGSHRDSVDTVAAGWEINKGVIGVEYDGATHLLDFDPALSYGDFGGSGAGPGLKPRKEAGVVQPVVLRYGHLWKTPLPRASGTVQYEHVSGGNTAETWRPAHVKTKTGKDTLQPESP